MKRRALLALPSLALLRAAEARAGGTAGSVPVRDDAAVRRALGDELTRSMAGLAIPGEARPHHLAYYVVDGEVAHVMAELGASSFDQFLRFRRMLAALRVGSPNLDQPSLIDATRLGGSAPLDDDYAALRRELWRASDEAYRTALQGFAEKKNLLATRVAQRAEDFPDFSSEPVHETVVAAPALDLAAEQPRLRELATRTSAVFAASPDLQTGTAGAWSQLVRRRMLGSDKTWADETRVFSGISLYAQAQAADGMMIAWPQSITGRAPSELPPAEQAETAARSLAERVLAVRGAPLAENGSAVVLFEAEAAAQLVRALLVGGLDGTPTVRGMADADGSLVAKLGFDVVAPGLDVYDDPSVEKLADGTSLWGSYRADDEGVPSRRVSLIERGVLKTLLMSRAPRKEIRQSNGHGRLAGVSIGNLFVSGRTPQPRKRLLELAARRATPAGAARPRAVYVVRRLAPPHAFGGVSGFATAGVMGFFEPPLWAGQGLAAVEAYSVVGGKEQPVRGLILQELDLRTLKDVIGVGDKPFAFNHMNGQTPVSIVTPPLLVTDVEVKRYAGENSKLPSYPAPK